TARIVAATASVLLNSSQASQYGSSSLSVPTKRGAKPIATRTKTTRRVSKNIETAKPRWQGFGKRNLAHPKPEQRKDSINHPTPAWPRPRVGGSESVIWH